MACWVWRLVTFFFLIVPAPYSGPKRCYKEPKNSIPIRELTTELQIAPPISLQKVNLPKAKNKPLM